MHGHEVIFLWGSKHSDFLWGYPIAIFVQSGVSVIDDQGFVKMNEFGLLVLLQFWVHVLADETEVESFIDSVLNSEAEVFLDVVVSGEKVRF